MNASSLFISLHFPFPSAYFSFMWVGLVYVVNHLTIVAIWDGLLTKFWPFSKRLRSTHCRKVETCGLPVLVRSAFSVSPAPRLSELAVADANQLKGSTISIKLDLTFFNMSNVYSLHCSAFIIYFGLHINIKTKDYKYFIQMVLKYLSSVLQSRKL